MLVGVSPSMWAWVFAMVGTALLFAYYPVCRAAYGDDRGPVRHITATVRWAGALFGFWVLVAIAPQAIIAARGYEWLVAATLAMVMLAWLKFRQEITLRLYGAIPLASVPDGFVEVMARSGTATTMTAYRAGLHGNLWATPLSVPSERGHAIVFGDALIQALDPHALTAMFAHEVARLEHWAHRHIASVEALKIGVAVVAVGTGLGLHYLPADIARLSAAVWGVSVLLVLALWTIARDGDQRDTDLRAVTLCGDASALIRALTVMYDLRRSPRRLSAFYEELSTQPSLARRLQGIRAAASIAPATLAAPLVISSPDLRQAVILDAARAQWVNGVSAHVPREPEALLMSADSIRSLAYRELTELQLVTGVRGGTWLKATHRSGRSWRVAIRQEDLDATQAALDVVDGRLAEFRTVTRRRAGLLALFAAAAAISVWAEVGISPVMILAGIVILRPRTSPSWLVALLIGLWAAQEGLAPTSTVPPFMRPLCAGVMAIGAMAFVFGPAARRRAVLRPTFHEAAVLAIALCAAAGLLVADILWIARSAAASIPHWRVDAVALSLMAGAGVLALSPGRSQGRWIAAASTGAVGIATFLWGMLALAAWSPLAFGTAVTVRDVPAPPAHVVALDPSARRLAVSLSGTHFAVQVGRARSGMPYRFLVGPFSGEPQPMSAYDVSFVGDTLALVLGPTTTGLALQGVPIEASIAVAELAWSVALPAVYMPRLSVDAVTGAWTVVGWHPEDADAISIGGRLGDSRPEAKRWPVPGADSSPAFFYLPETRTAFLVTRTTLSSLPALLSRLAGVPERRWQIRKLDGTADITLATTAATLLCLDPMPHDDTLFCLARHSAHTVLWSIASRTGRITEAGTVAPFQMAALSSSDLCLALENRVVLQIPRGRREGRRFVVSEPGDIFEMRTTGRHLAMLLRSANEVRVSLSETR